MQPEKTTDKLLGAMPAKTPPLANSQGLLAIRNVIGRSTMRQYGT
jgi:hypothetical protein